MTNEIIENKRFILPPQNLFEANGSDDPLPYYYKPFIGRLYRARIEQGLSMLNPPYKRILEIGFGSGIVLPSLCRLSNEVYGVDLDSDPDRVHDSLAQVKCSCSLIKGDITAAEYEEGYFDLIVAFSILEHIPNLGQIMAILQRLLEPSGNLLIGMPRVDTAMTKAFELIGFRNIDDHHVSTRDDCLKASKQHFEIVNRKHLPSFLPNSLALYYNMLFRKS